ncbi:hypothetical protein N7478_003298 [Penicillium angulare]|uniref:uncharacterized protein n=1 Tax=Penicillium angulare TaxID=116970 RepID=UPI0025412544|nr:uncharacterized protein N7478_003298 [Penicillium angulare]KAJ5287612.1 hypothetical protein N7478_003298 [Penicillium angulare]
MNDEGTACERLAANARRFAAFTGLIEVDSLDRFFIIWHGRRIHLIDTPGFNDPNRSDVETLKVLSSYLGASYANEVRINGILMLQPNDRDNLEPISRHNINKVKAICGFAGYRNFCIVTTMWPRESDLKDNRQTWNQCAFLRNREMGMLRAYYGDLQQSEAFSRRFNETGTWNQYEQKAHAQHIMSQLIGLSDGYKPEALQFPREFFQERKILAKSSVGTQVGIQLYKARKAYEEQLAEVTAQMEKAAENEDAENLAELTEVKDEIEECLSEGHQDQAILKGTFEDFHGDEQQEWKEKMDVLEIYFREEIDRKDTELLALEDLVRSMHKEAERNHRLDRQKREKAMAEAEDYQDAI